MCYTRYDLSQTNVCNENYATENIVKIFKSRNSQLVKTLEMYKSDFQIMKKALSHEFQITIN